MKDIKQPKQDKRNLRNKTINSELNLSKSTKG